MRSRKQVDILFRVDTDLIGDWGEIMSHHGEQCHLSAQWLDETGFDHPHKIADSTRRCLMALLRDKGVQVALVGFSGGDQVFEIAKKQLKENEGWASIAEVPEDEARRVVSQLAQHRVGGSPEMP